MGETYASPISQPMPKLLSGFEDVDFEELRAAIPFEQHQVHVYGKAYDQPRLTKWYGLVPYTYSGLTNPPDAMPPLVEALRRRCEGVVGLELNSVLANLYRDGADTVGWHADDEAIFGGDPVIASLSFGGTRTFKMRLKTNHETRESFELTHGSLLTMEAGIQHLWEHSVPRTKKPVGPRINVTLRQTIRTV